MHRLKALAASAVLIISTPTLAQVDSDEIAQLREQIRLLSERLDQLERSSQGAIAQEQTAPRSSAVAESATAVEDAELDQRINAAVDAKVEERMAAASWAERMSWSGDFRYRYEDIKLSDRPNRNRNRIRARASLIADINENTKVGLGMATGSEDPVSTNQTLGGGGSSKPLNLDLAYLEWRGLANTTIVGGKFKQPQYSAGGYSLIWDSDWRPEGTGITWDNGKLFAIGLGSWVESDSNSGKQEFAYGLQGGFRLPIGDNMQFVAGAGYYEFDSAGKGSFFGDGDFFGNSFDPETNTYLFDYHEVEAFAELHFSLMDKPAMVFVDYVQNLEVDDNDVGYAAGMTLGETKQRGDWEFGAYYKKLEADAVLGLLTDSNFGGGGTASKCFEFELAYALQKH